tara:strand:+ start:962 stop:1327 length:366 start_codon:yes stop_codon:yes gene_type:complete
MYERGEYVSRFRLSPEQLLNIQVRAFSDSVPEKVLVGKAQRLVKLSQNEIKAARLAVWYILKRAWGHSTAVQHASGSFEPCNKTNVRRAINEVFPHNYFHSLQMSKNCNFYEDLETLEDDK